MRRFSLPVLTVLFLMCVPVPRNVVAWAFVTLTGGWEASIGSELMTGGAGSDLAPTIESAADAVRLETESSSDWRMDVSRIMGDWPAELVLSVRASSARALGPGSASAVSTYRAVTAEPFMIASGTYRAGPRARARIELQYLVEGIAASMGAGTRTTTIVYTITDS